MTTRLPIELFDLIAQVATDDTLARLSTISRIVYSIVIPALYTKISLTDMCMSRIIKCLNTLSRNPELARIPRLFLLSPPPSLAFLRAFCVLLTRALGNMTELHTLFLLSQDIPTSVLRRMSCQLGTLVSTAFCEDSYPTSKFISTQPAIEKLVITCSPSDIRALSPEALPALKELYAPLLSLPTLLPPRGSHLDRLCVIGALYEAEHFHLLYSIFKDGLVNPPESLELVIGMNIIDSMSIVVVALGLALIGFAAPFVTSLMLEIQTGYIQQDELQNMFVFALPWFSNLQKLTVTPSAPRGGPPTRNSPGIAPIVATMRAHKLRRALEAVSKTQVEMSDLSQIRFSRMQNQPSPVPDVLNDESCHRKLLHAWRQVHPELEWVILSNLAHAYNLKKEETGGNTQGA